MTTQNKYPHLFDESNEVYHAYKAVGSSLLRDFMDSPLRFYGKWIGNYTQNETKDLRIGSAVHCAVLEEEEFKNRYVPEPQDIKRTTKEGKEKYEAFLKENDTSTILATDELETVMNVKNSILSHPHASNLLNETVREKVARVELSNGLTAQCRPDAVRDNVIIDLKTCRDIAMFEKEIFWRKYYIQGAFYYFILKSIMPEFFGESSFYMIACEKKEPYETRIFAINNDDLEQSIPPILQTLEEIKEFLEEGESTVPAIQWVNVN